MNQAGAEQSLECPRWNAPIRGYCFCWDRNWIICKGVGACAAQRTVGSLSEKILWSLGLRAGGPQETLAGHSQTETSCDGVILRGSCRAAGFVVGGPHAQAER